MVFGFADMLAKIDLSSIAIDTDIDKDNKVEAVDPCPLIDPSAHDLIPAFEKDSRRRPSSVKMTAIWIWIRQMSWCMSKGILTVV